MVIKMTNCWIVLIKFWILSIITVSSKTQDAKKPLKLEDYLMSKSINPTDFQLFQSFQQLADNVKLQSCKNSDMFCRGPELIRKYGYPVETHHVTTPDGYILTTHRIPYGRKSPPVGHGEKKIVVFLAHGILNSVTDFLMNRVDKALGYKLADAGYDVWINNARGNSYSIGHKSLNRKDPLYWDFSFHEMGAVDLPLWIDYILDKTGQKDMYYIGHSMGTTKFFITMSLHPQYNSKIRTMFAMAPSIFVNGTMCAWKYMAPFSKEETVILEKMGGEEFVPSVFQDNLKYLGIPCDKAVEKVGLCDNFLYLVAGYNPDQTNSSQVPIILSHIPDSTSSKTMNHYLQFVISEKFRQYDYGKNLNRKHYLKSSPPDYDLSKITAPIVFFHSDGDKVLVTEDVERGASELPNLKKNYRVAQKTFTHIDFTYGKDADKFVYDRILKIMDKSTYYPWH